ncbi:DUF6049 family protein [Tessaracoccus sp. MC1756]|uniref:DUF6049 family protein n=1 Tax=Tessaracoccus sp. MC1756 TaxID=2760311 RepID=UPI0021067F9F|nr:DUF6049 family protein [Tessaracoccus sp. MC1756]
MVGRLLRALLAAMLLAMGLVGTPSTANAASEYLDVEITSISTPTLNLDNPEQVVEIQGRLTNVSTTPIRYVNVHFWRAPVPILTTDELTSITANLPVGNRLFEESAGNLDILTRDEPFGPGERANFTVRATVAELVTEGPSQVPLGRDDAVYLLGVQVRGIPDDAENMVVGRAQVVTPATQQPVGSSALVVLAGTPSWLPDGTFLDDSLTEQLSGRLETLLSSAERPGVISAVDPALYQAVQWLSAEHTVAGEARPANGVALRWVERVDALADDGRLWRLPFANPDLVRVDATGQLPRVLAWAREATPEDLLELPSVAVLDEGANTDLVSKLGEFSTVVIRNATGASVGPPRVLTAAPQGAVTALPAGVQLARKIADELLAPRPPLYVIDTPEAAAIDNELAPYREHVPATTTPAEPLRWADAQTPAAYQELVAALDEQTGNASLMADLTPSAEAYDLAAVGATVYSKGFPTEAAAVDYLNAASPAEVDLSRVTLRAAANYVMGARVNEFPATLSNELDIPIVVGVEFSSDAPQRISVPGVKAVEVPARGTATITITPEAAANGVALVRPRLVTAEGQLLSEGPPIEITATDLGRVGWIIIVVSGAVVLGGTAWRIAAVRRERARADQGLPPKGSE